MKFELFELYPKKELSYALNLEIKIINVLKAMVNNKRDFRDSIQPFIPKWLSLFYIIWLS